MLFIQRRASLRALQWQVPMAMRAASTTASPTKDVFELSLNYLRVPGQDVFAGVAAVEPFVKHLQKQGATRPLIVTDGGVEKAGIATMFSEELEKHGMKGVFFCETQPDPSTSDVAAIAEAFDGSDVDSCIGLGGGAPLDAAKAAVAVVAKSRVDASFSIARDTARFITNDMREYLSDAPPEFVKAIPYLAAVPTTAGTGSDGGKSAVITNLNGVKVVLGHPALLPSAVALAPQYTARMPAGLTAATGVDALIHAAEAWFVPHEAAKRDGMSDEEIAEAEDYALRSIRLVVNNLHRAFKVGDDLQARLNMQVAALFAAKAFRKGDLGGIHATAHALGAVHHLHHGKCILKMAVPVLAYNEAHYNNEQACRSNVVRDIFVEGGYNGEVLSEALASFLTPFNIPLGLADVLGVDIDRLAEAAAADGCQTNSIPMDVASYKKVFENAMK